MAREVKMKKSWNSITALLLAAVICLALGACGSDERDVVADNGENPAPSPNVSVKTGTIATDSWGYTGSSPIQVSAPSQTEILINGHTLLLDASQGVVSGNISTRISFSSDRTTLTATAQASAPANFVSYVNILMGPAKTAFPAVSVTVDVSPAAPGATLTVYNYDAGTGIWISAQTAVVSSSGKITFPVTKLSLWGIFG
jgi:hypothetical protein